LERELGIISGRVRLKRIQGASTQVIDRVDYSMSTGTLNSTVIEHILNIAIRIDGSSHCTVFVQEEFC
jgi:hypothetical protein